MQYSEEPHAYYVKDGVGPGADYLGDLERWNWRYLMYGLGPAPGVDAALILYFNEYQRELMRLPPAEAFDKLKGFMTGLDDKVASRASMAQARLFPGPPPPKEDNVIYVNFGKRQ